MAKSYKIIIALFLTLVLSIAMMICSVPFGNASALTAKLNPTTYFTFSDGVSGEFKEDALVANVKGGDTITFNNRLVINDMAIEMVVPSGLTALLSITTDSYYVNGNRNADDEFDTAIVTEVEIVGTGSETTVKIGVDDDDYVTFNGVKVESDDYYRVENVDGKTLGSIAIEFKGADASGDFKLISLDQKASDVAGKYKQGFEIKNGSIEIAYPRVVIADNFYTKVYDEVTGEYDYVARVEQYNKKYDLAMISCSLLGGYVGSDIFLSGDETAVQFETGTERPDALRFKTLGDVTFNISGKVDGLVVNYETCTVKVIREGYDENGVKDQTAPKYIYNADAFDGFLYQLSKEYEVLDENGNKLHSAPLGSELAVPSMKDFVIDNVTSYENLSSKVVYKSSAVDSSSTDLKFNLNDVGNYMFYVSFADAEGNTMSGEQFLKVNEDDSITYGVYADYIFNFSIDDDAPIKVDAAVAESVGYKGVKYAVSKFVLDANECQLTYTLYYSRDLNADPADESAWVAVPKASSVTDKSYSDENGFNYDSVKAIGYDGELAFTPTEIGSYKIECVATSKVSSRSDSDYTVVRVEREPSQVVVDNHWWQKNMWSVIFLSVGSLCLIGIVVLIFVKPKDDGKKN